MRTKSRAIHRNDDNIDTTNYDDAELEDHVKQYSAIFYDEIMMSLMTKAILTIIYSANNNKKEKGNNNDTIVRTTTTVA